MIHNEEHHNKSRRVESPNGGLMYKFIILASARVVCNIMVCKCKVEPIGNCILESKFISKLIKS
jgi:hypothetical protein